MASADWRLPAEWERQDGVLLAWPHPATDWSDRLASVESTYAALAAAITRFETAIICVPDATVRDRARSMLPTCPPERLRFVTVEYDDTWLRDSGPLTLAGLSGFRLLDFRFTGWGGKFDARRDDELVANLMARGLFRNAERRRVDFALEGGAIESDGQGTLLTTWTCLNRRHPRLSRADLDARLLKEFNANRVLWLEHGEIEGDDTDAHVDTLARFAPDDAIVYQSCGDVSDRHHADLSAMADELADLRTASGSAYRLFPLPWPRGIIDEGRRLPASYANYLVLNDAIVMPAYGDAADDRAAEVLAAAHPRREIVPVDARSLIWQNGSVHCVTMQLPEGVLARAA